MKTLKDYKEKQMQNPEFEEEYAKIQPEMDVICAIVNARVSQNLTQKEQAETELNTELEKGYADMVAGRTKPVKQAFADIRKDYGKCQ